MNTDSAGLQSSGSCGGLGCLVDRAFLHRACCSNGGYVSEACRVFSAEWIHKQRDVPVLPFLAKNLNLLSSNLNKTG